RHSISSSSIAKSKAATKPRIGRGKSPFRRVSQMDGAAAILERIFVMRGFLRKLLIGCVPVLLLLGCKRAEPVVVSASASPPRLRELDFTPFEKALAALSKDRFAAVDRVVREGDFDSVAAAMAQGKVTAEELTLYFLDRIQKRDEH